MQRIEQLDLTIPDDLPIAARSDEIISLLRERQVIVVSGETGSGKSTQLPKLCLAAGLGYRGMIGHTQPRRLAARSIAVRLAEELKTNLGEEVGFKIRFADQTKRETLVKLMTDGILLAETQQDRDLKRYSTIIIDEAHERSLNIDFLLGYVKRTLSRRRDLKLVITSATIDAERFAEHFADASGPAPIVVVEGRSYPVEVRYRPWEQIAGLDEEGLPRPYDLGRHCGAAVDELMNAGNGDLLIFLPTERDIREVSHYLSGHLRRQGRAGTVELLPLYARLPQSEQQRIFQPTGHLRRIVLATNVAESSLTVPGIRYVVDTGTARISRYSPRSKVQRLPIEPVSQASARQRAGRCGRVAPGICVRLFSEEDFLSRDEYTTPEIRRTNLASVILQTKALRLGSIDQFPFLDPPRPDAIREGYRTLFEIGALDDRKHLTEVGKKLGRMPVDPRVGRMILAAQEEGVLPEVLVIAAALEAQDPRERPPDKQKAADEAQAIFQDGRSDFLAYLRLWQFYHDQRENLSRNQLQKALRNRFLSPNRMREWADIVKQLKDLATEFLRCDKKQLTSPRVEVDWNDSTKPIVDEVRYQAVHRALLTGLLSGVAMLGDKHQYTGAGGLKLFLWPGSGVFTAGPKWIVAAELVETSRQYARCVARVQPEWLEQLGAHLVKKSYSDPYWSEKQGGAMCAERVSLFGMPIVPRRNVPLAPIDPTTARELLIEQGLVERQMPTRARSIQHNRKLRDTFADLAAKTRRRDLVVDPYTLLRFYQERLPQEVVDRGSLERWDRQQTPPSWAARLKSIDDLVRWLDAPPIDAVADPTLPSEGSPTSRTIYMQPNDLLRFDGGRIDAEAFPDHLDLGPTRLPLEYHFAPGADNDGVTVTVPQAALMQLSDQRLGWLVPGLFEEKITALIKALPKRIRRNLVPAADTAKVIAAELSTEMGQVPFMPTLCQILSRRAEMPVTEADFAGEKLPEHLQFLVKVVDDDGKMVAQGRSLREVRTQLKLDEEPDPVSEAASFVATEDDLNRDGMTTFDLDQLPREVIRRRGGVQVAQYPALIDRGNSVDVRVLSNEKLAQQRTRGGLMRLYAIAERKELRSQVRWLPNLERSRLLLAKALSPENFEAHLIDLLARRAFVDGQPSVDSREQFEARRANRGQRIAIATQEVAIWLPALAEAVHSVALRLEEKRGPALQYAADDVRRQIDALLFDGFVHEVPWQWLEHYPRYFRAIDYRFEKLRSGAQGRDRELTDEVQRLEAKLQAARQLENADSVTLDELRWMIEELRVSLFAQPLGTSVKVSPQRIEKQLS